MVHVVRAHIESRNSGTTRKSLITSSPRWLIAPGVQIYTIEDYFADGQPDAAAGGVDGKDVPGRGYWHEHPGVARHDPRPAERRIQNSFE